MGVDLTDVSGGVQAESDIGTDSSSAVDFDLGADFDTPDADSSLANEIESAGIEDESDIDMDATVFSLPDLHKSPSAAADDDDEDKTLVLGRHSDASSVDDMQTKLDLAQAYMETGDTEGARNLLGEVMAAGSDLQQATAREMLTKLG